MYDVPTIQELVNKVKDHGGRFLTRGNDNLYCEMNDRDARKKAVQGKQAKTIVYTGILRLRD